MSEWIDIRDRLPSEMENCLIINTVGDIAVGWFEESDFECWDDRFHNHRLVTHWMPLPKPPKKEE
jgi:hypothetical protein